MSTSSISSPKPQNLETVNLRKPPYQVDQQVKFMHLEAEVDFLLQELQHIKMQRLADSQNQE
ncbi:MAG: hypothetical protein AAF378_04980 [Cyanobacteria bacterium P01_A01_bin.84]